MSNDESTVLPIRDDAVPERGVASSNSPLRGLRNTLRALGVSQCFVVPHEKAERVRHDLWQFRQRPENVSKQFMTRSMMEDGVKILKVWRIS